MGGAELYSVLKYGDNKISLPPSYLVNDYFTSFLASYIREQLLANCDKFSFETVMSHPSKLDFMTKAKNEVFKVYLYFVSLISPDLNVARVEARVKEGGHDVPENKIRERYERTMNNLLPAIEIADESYIFDNSGNTQNLFAHVEDGNINLLLKTIPSWFQEYVLKQLK
jgi:predicted ABC-type ATPase